MSVLALVWEREECVRVCVSVYRELMEPFSVTNFRLIQKS